MLIDSIAEKRDLWLVYELAPGKTINEHMFTVKGEFYKGERIYQVQHSSFYHEIRNNFTLLQDFLLRMSQALQILFKLGIVHADLKPDNVIIDYDEANKQILSLKLIDFGSAFLLRADGKTLEHQ